MAKRRRAVWPYDLRQATHLRNFLPDKEYASSPLEKFSKTSVTSNLKENQAFGSPFFDLHNRLTGVRGVVPKWEPRYRLGINVGPSTKYAESVYLILNLHMAKVSPQFHISYDDFFDTICLDAGNPPIYSHWQALKGLQKNYQPVIYPNSTPPNRVERPEAIIIQDAPISPSEERDEKLPMEDFPAIKEDTPTSDVDNTPHPLLPQMTTQEGTSETAVPTRTSSRIWKASSRALEIREQQYPNLNKAFSAVQ